MDLPWILKFLLGPVVDLLGDHINFLDLAHVGLLITLLAVLLLPPSELAWLRFVVLGNNIFGATLDVATDAMAVDGLEEDEDSSANALMALAQDFGCLLGGEVALWLSQRWCYEGGVAFAFLALLCLRTPPMSKREVKRPSWPSSRSPTERCL